MGIKCEDFRCKFHRDGACGLDEAVCIGADGKCSSFEKGMLYYFNLVWNALKNKNFVDAVELDEELKIGLYYVMSVFHLGFSEMEWGTCRMIMLKNGEEGPALNYNDIVALPVDEEVFRKLLSDFDAGILPGACAEKMFRRRCPSLSAGSLPEEDLQRETLANTKGLPAR